MVIGEGVRELRAGLEERIDRKLGEFVVHRDRVALKDGSLAGESVRDDELQQVVVQIKVDCSVEEVRVAIF